MENWVGWQDSGGAQHVFRIKDPIIYIVSITINNKVTIEI